MDIQSQLSEDNKVLTLTLEGKFDYTCHQDFLNAYENVNPVPEKVILDTLGLVTIDSSALGMLLLLRNFAGGDDSDITLINCKPDTQKLMRSCKFDELFVVQALD